MPVQTVIGATFKRFLKSIILKGCAHFLFKYTLQTIEYSYVY